MDEKSKNNNISFRLSDENNEKLENYAKSYDSQKSTIAANFVINALHDNLEDITTNHISFPRPVIKKMFSLLSEDQLKLIIADFNMYNKELIESALHDHSSSQILNLCKKWFKRSGCEVKFTSFDKKKTLVIHHELEKNWSIIACAITSFILDVLGFDVNFTSVSSDWFKIEYSMK